ncbi:MAG: serine/threonine protein kinase [Deltaproteobacteria bacterium]|nr:serine/threonine protein kinase [Deltaproteobacteria bacterium]
MASVHQRYRIIEKIDAGGMAEIYRGEAVSIDGFARTVAIKRILPSMCTDAKFVSMFLDEARLSMQLTHANIVQIFDIGKADDTYFVVMELIDGANLRRLMQRIVDSGGSFPVALACYITMETCRGLAYAHEKAGSDGKALGIVHRDVSPPNVLISKQGEVKLTDFGLAKAASHATHTDAGVIKGKFAYLSPEVVDGKEVDLRADVYAAGIMLWEMLCGRKLFAGKTDMETVELVRKGDVDKPSRLRTELDDELDRIVLKALARNPKRRYQTARAFEQAIAGFLFKHNLRVTATDMSEWMRGFESDGEGEVPFDVIDILRAEFEEAAHAGRVDPHIGQRPLGPTDLATRGGAMLPIGDLLGKLAQLPLEDLAGDRDAAPAPVPLADRLDAPETLPEVRGESADGGGGAGKWIAVAAVVALLAAGVAAWQLGLLPLP